MKIPIILLSVVLIIPTLTLAQSGKKPVSKEKAPTQKEMAELMNEMQGAMDEMSPDEKKAMESLGIKMPEIKSMKKNIAGISDAQLKKAFEEDNRIVPLKDMGRITNISKTPLSDAALPAFLQSLHSKLTNHLDSSSKNNGEKIYQWLKKEYSTPTASGNAAVGLWMMGNPKVALYVLSKTCKDNPADADNLNNLSALLTMGGAEQLAMPLLNNLNKKYPANSTLLNNIGQAWFGLGEMDKAGKYLDSTIRIYPAHSQANLTQSLIHESKGDKLRAVEAVRRSIKEGYSEDKEEHLRKLDHKLKSEDLTWDRPMPKDALGLERFTWPEYPMQVEQSGALEMEWNAFYKTCDDEISVLEQQQKKLEEIVTDVHERRTNEILLAAAQGLIIDPMPGIARKASIKLNYLIDGKDRQLDHKYGVKLEAAATSFVKAGQLEDKLKDQLKLLVNADCSAKNKAINSFLKEANTILQTSFVDYAAFMRRMLNDRAYYSQYTTWPEQFELAKVQIKLMWLQTMKMQKPQFKKMCISEAGEPAELGKFKLAEFDDLHCNYHSECDLIIGVIKSDCSTLTGKLDLTILKNTLNIEVIKLGLKMKQGERDDESLWDQFQTATVQLGFKKGVGAGAGPLKVEAKAGVAGFIEIGKHGITDVAIIASGDIKAGTNLIKVMDGTKEIINHSQGPVKDQSVTIIGAEAKISVVSGFTVEGKGVLKGLKN